jgi:pyruvate,orthophosphate dikinase
MAATRRAVLLPGEGAEATLSPDVRGGKGANLADMATLGLPVPPFFTVPTGICRAYMEHGKLPKRTAWHLKRGIAALEEATGRKFGSNDNPLLVSVRSGAPVSMPGMMDTVLNVGMSSGALDALCKLGGEEFADDVFNRFSEQFGMKDEPFVVYGQYLGFHLAGREEPEPWNQLIDSITNVLDSWNSERAKAYRAANGIQGWIGTAVNVQAMVFGNLDEYSGTGVVFSANPSTGDDGLFGEWLPKAQGEDIVSGTRTPLPLADLSASMPEVYEELKGYVEMLSAHVGGVADVEFTVEAGKLYILQVRRAKVSSVAAATMAVRAQWTKKISREEAVLRLTDQQIRQLSAASFSSESLEQAVANGHLVAEGLPASTGAAVGRVVYSSQEAIEAAAQGTDVILVRPDTSPDDLPGMLASKAIVTGTGGMTCHAAVVANAQGIPAVVGIGELPSLASGEYVSVDATNGRIFRGKLPLDGEQRTKEVSIFLKWVSQTKPTPKLDFSLLERRFCMNQVLNDFYLAQRMAKAAIGTSLERETDDLWRQIRNNTATLMGTYLTVAISGELRHFYDGSLKPQLSETPIKADELFAKYVDRVGSDRYMSQMSGVLRLDGAQLADQIRFAELSADIFADPGWSGGIGGKAWAAIARALLAYLDGSWEFDTFVDHAFDLRHNSGVLFNKHPMVTGRTTYLMERLIPTQLTIKKDVSDVRELHRKLGEIKYESRRYSPDGEPAFGEEVMNTWNKGERLGLW